jgi:hypothetical protein
MRLPSSNAAILDLHKIQDYFHDPSHPRGRHKARVFRQALGLEQIDAAWLRDRLLEGARSAEATQVMAGAWGSHWRLDVAVRRQDKMAMVRTI